MPISFGDLPATDELFDPGSQCSHLWKVPQQAGGVVLFQRRPDVETGLHVVVLVLHPKIIGIYYYFCCYVLFSSKGPFVGRVYKMSQPCAVD